MGLLPSLVKWGHNGEKTATVIQEDRLNILHILLLNDFSFLNQMCILFIFMSVPKMCVL